MQSALGSCLPARERSRQAEPWEHAVVEAGEGADPVAGEGEDVRPVRRHRKEQRCC